MKKVISIIIPTYNMESYLDACLSSLIIGGLERIEVIVVNDGSSDGSMRIAQSYVDKYPESFLIIDKENGNYGSCINHGLYKATGKYIKVLDADDSFYTDNFKEMVDILEKTDVDLFFSDKINLYTDKEEYRKLPFPEDCVCDFEEYFAPNYKQFDRIWMHHVTYRREILTSIGYRQTEGISYTDNEWIYRPMAYVKSWYYMGKPVYRYLLAREGQTMSAEFGKKHIHDRMVVTFRMLDYYKEMIAKRPELKDVFHFRIYRRLRMMYRTVIVKWDAYDDKEMAQLDQLLKKEYPDLYKEMESLNLKKHLLPFRYVKIWRKNYTGWRIKAIVKIYHWKKRTF